MSNPDGFQVELGSVDPYLATFKVDVSQMAQVTSYNGKKRKIRRDFIDPNHPFALGYVDFNHHFVGNLSF